MPNEQPWAPYQPIYDSHANQYDPLPPSGSNPGGNGFISGHLCKTAPPCVDQSLKLDGASDYRFLWSETLRVVDSLGKRGAPKTVHLTLSLQLVPEGSEPETPAPAFTDPAASLLAAAGCPEAGSYVPPPAAPNADLLNFGLKIFSSKSFRNRKNCYQRGNIALAQVRDPVLRPNVPPPHSGDTGAFHRAPVWLTGDYVVTLRESNPREPSKNRLWHAMKDESVMWFVMINDGCRMRIEHENPIFAIQENREYAMAVFGRESYLRALEATGAKSTMHAKLLRLEYIRLQPGDVQGLSLLGSPVSREYADTMLDGFGLQPKGRPLKEREIRRDRKKRRHESDDSEEPEEDYGESSAWQRRPGSSGDEARADNGARQNGNGLRAESELSPHGHIDRRQRVWPIPSKQDLGEQTGFDGFRPNLNEGLSQMQAYIAHIGQRLTDAQNDMANLFDLMKHMARTHATSNGLPDSSSMDQGSPNGDET